MLSERFSEEDLARILLPREAYRPFPVASDRDAWDSLPDPLRMRRIEAAAEYLGWEWPALPATLFMEFRREGNRSRFEKSHFDRRRALCTLVIGECIEAKGRFLDDIINGIWHLCEESFWGVPAHNQAGRFSQAPLPDTTDRVIDLFASETGALLACTYYLIGPQLDAIHSVIGDRLRREVRERILEPYREKHFWWMGLENPSHQINNWNPWCNSNCLLTVLLLEDDPTLRVQSVARAVRSLDRFLDAYLPDGGCDEGTSYWDRAGGSLLDCLELLHSATAGAIDVFQEPLVRNIGRYLYRAYIGGDWFINFADGSAKVALSTDLVYRYGWRIQDERLMALGSSAYHRHPEGNRKSIPMSLLRALPLLFTYQELEAATAVPPYVRDVWLDGIQVMAAREREGAESGLYVAAKGGHNAESHNHNDIGQFIVFRDGRPILIDVGVETYSAKTFNEHRYEIWTMQSAYHNLPTIGGVQQQAGREFAARAVAYTASDAGAELNLDIAGAYPSEAGITTWKRTVAFDRTESPASVRVRDRFLLTQPTAVTLSLMTPCEPSLEAPGTILLSGESPAHLTYPATDLTVEIERIPIDDARLGPVWGDHLYRLILQSRGPIAEGDWEVQVVAAG